MFSGKDLFVNCVDADSVFFLNVNFSHLNHFSFD